METQRGEFRGKHKALAVGIVKHRLLSEPITREKQFLFLAIINRQRPHPVQFL